jgi:aminopeptidase N
LILLCAGASQALATAPDFRVFDYQLDLTIDRAERSVAGHERLRLRSTGDGLGAVGFPRNGLEVRAVTTDRGATLATRLIGDQIEVRLPRALARGQELSIVVDYTAREPKGIVFHPDAVYTVFHTCHWMLCRDRPDDKATLTLAIAAPEGLTMVASGAPVKRGVWRERVPSSTYLFGFALGNFTRVSRTHQGVTLEYFTTTGDADWLARAFAGDEQMLDFFVAKAGRRLPRSFYRQVVVDGDAAQEMSSFSVLGRGELERRLADPSEDWLIAHELAHQFWGNLVTCADWPHFWLNEGLTTFMVAAWKEQRWGRQAYERELGLWRARHQTAVEARFDVPLTFAGEYPSLRIKRAVVYSKGALFLARLREVMGERAFWEGLARYTRRHAGGSAVTQDLQRAFAAGSDQDLSKLFDEWAYGGAADPAR